MHELVKGSVCHSVQPYIDLVRSEPVFERSERLENVIFNFITVAVQDGKYKISSLAFLSQVRTNESLMNFRCSIWNAFKEYKSVLLFVILRKFAIYGRTPSA